MSSAPVAIAESSPLYDFTTSADQAFGTNAMADLGYGVFGMWGGDASRDEMVTSSDFTGSWLLQMAGLLLNVWLPSN